MGFSPGPALLASQPASFDPHLSKYGFIQDTGPWGSEGEQGLAVLDTPRERLGTPGPLSSLSLTPITARLLINTHCALQVAADPGELCGSHTRLPLHPGPRYPFPGSQFLVGLT